MSSLLPPLFAATFDHRFFCHHFLPPLMSTLCRRFLSRLLATGRFSVRVYEVIRRIRKCFKSGSPQVVLRGLDLTDTLMQSCGAHVRREVSSDKFLKTVGKLCKVRLVSCLVLALPGVACLSILSVGRSPVCLSVVLSGCLAAWLPVTPRCMILVGRQQKQ